MRVEEVIGDNIRRRRDQLGLTQEDVGRGLARFLGREWPRQAVFSAERGGRSFTANEVFGFALALNMSVGDLFRAPGGVDSVMLSSGVSVDVRFLEVVGAPGDPNAMQELRDLLRELEKSQRTRLGQDQEDVVTLEAARRALDALAQEWHGDVAVEDEP